MDTKDDPENRKDQILRTLQQFILTHQSSKTSDALISGSGSPGGRYNGLPTKSRTIYGTGQGLFVSTMRPATYNGSQAPIRAKDRQMLLQCNEYRYRYHVHLVGKEKQGKRKSEGKLIIS
jgi:hypothetical protein